MSKQAGDELIAFNGINGVTGGYLTEPMPVKDLVEVVRRQRQPWSEEHLQELRYRKLNKQVAFRVLPEYGDGSDLKKVGWGIIFPAGADPIQVDSILQAMEVLVAHRKTQCGKRFKICRGKDGVQWNNGRPETKNEFLERHGVGPGSVEPDYLPFYLLIIADPQSIPFSFQYELDVQYAVGRIYFQTLEEYVCYAHSVVESEGSAVSLVRRSVFFGVSHPSDQATTLSAEYLVKPLHKYVNDRSAEFELGWRSELVEPEDAYRETLKSLLGGSQTPAFLFTATHGMAWPYQHKLQRKYQGALVCQDWKGPDVEKVSREHFLTAEDIPDSHNLLGTVVFHFACFGAGTPYWDEFAIAQNQARPALTSRPFLSALPMRLLSHPNGGALAVVGHIERAWTYSFSWGELKSQTQAFQSMLFQLMNGKPVGLALDDMNVRYSEIASLLSTDLQNLKYDSQAVSPYELAFKWAAHNDARGYAILGDPAVRPPVAQPEVKQNIRPAIVLSSRYHGILPVVFAAEALDPLNESERQEIAEENRAVQNAQASSATVIEVSSSSPDAEDSSSSDEIEVEMTGPGAELPVDSLKVAPRQEIQGEQKHGAQTSVLPQPYASPIDGLAFALQAYVSEQEGSFSFGVEGVSYNLLDDAKGKVKEVVVNLNQALGNLAKKMQEVTSDAATLKITTSVVDDLTTRTSEEERFVTEITAAGDIKVYVPRQAEEIDEVLLALHKEMVNEAMNNRIEIVKAIGEMVASLFGVQKS